MIPGKSQPIRSILTITVGFVILYLIYAREAFLWIASAIGVMGLISGYLADKIDFLWMKLAWLLSLIIPKILLSVIFYLILFPIAILSRIFSEPDPLRLKNNTNTLFKEVNKTFDPESFSKPW